MRRASFRSSILLAALVAGASFQASAVAVQADEYSIVPKGDALLRNLSIVERSGWLSSTATSNANDAAVTRYELALQTAGAIFLVSARAESDATWAQSVSPAALKALRDLTTTLRPELQKLGVDTQATLQSLARIAKTSASKTRGAIGNSSIDNAASIDAISTERARRNVLPLPARFSADKSFAPEGNYGVSLGLGRGFSLRASVRPNANANANSLANLALPESQLPRGNASAFGGGLDWRPRDNVLFSTNVENIVGGAQNGATRFSGGVGVSALRNRVSLQANLSRLRMENVADSSTLAGVNVGVGVSSNVSLNLLYQQLFSTPTPTRSDRVLAGGVSIKF